MAHADREPQAKRPLLAAGARPAAASGGGQGTLLSLGVRAPTPGAGREARMAGLYDLQEVIGKVPYLVIWRWLQIVEYKSIQRIRTLFAN
jgi:hypothetical protein